MAELIMGKYKFYPYEFDKSKASTLEDLEELVKKAKARNEKDVKMPFQSVVRRRPRRKRHG